MKEIFKLLLTDVIKFFIGYSVIFLIASKITENLPRSWDPTGIGMMALIILIIGFVIGAYRVGASYSDNLDVQQPGSLFKLFKRPVRSSKYGFASLVLCFGLFYLVVIVSSYFGF